MLSLQRLWSVTVTERFYMLLLILVFLRTCQVNVIGWNWTVTKYKPLPFLLCVCVIILPDLHAESGGGHWSRWDESASVSGSFTLFCKIIFSASDWSKIENSGELQFPCHSCEFFDMIKTENLLCNQKSQSCYKLINYVGFGCVC